MTDLFLPLIFLLGPYLLLFYMSAEIYLRNPGSIKHRLTALLIISISFLFLGEFLFNVLPYEKAQLAARYIKLPSAFTTMTIGLYFVRLFTYARLSRIYQVMALLPLFGIIPLVFPLPGFEISLEKQSYWYIEIYSTDLIAVLLITGIYSIILFLLQLFKALLSSKPKLRVLREKERYRVMLRGAALTCIWGVLALFVFRPYAEHAPILPPGAMSAYSVLFLVYAIRHVMINYDFLSTTGRRYQMLFKLSRNGIALVDQDGYMAETNPAFIRMLGITDQKDASWKGRRIYSFITIEDAKLYEWVNEKFADKEPFHAEIRVTNFLGESYIMETDVEYIEVDGQIWCFMMTKDITQQKDSEAKLEFLAYHDPLTGLGNRRKFQERLGEYLEQMNPETDKLAVLLIDLDQFKWINDTLGHSAGDELLRMASDRLQTIIPGKACVSRLGGDEFIVLLPWLSGTDEALECAHLIIRALREPFLFQNSRFQISASIGISIAPRDGMEVELIVGSADSAMYEAKREGRNQFHLFRPSQKANAEKALKLANCLQRALEEEEFSLHYQPQIDIRTNRVIGVEALLRWRSAEIGVVSPGDFIPLAEETGAIVPIGEWVIRTALAEGLRWISSGREDFVVSVNLSARQLKDPTLAAKLRSMLELYQFPPANLCLEITESTMIGDVEQTLKVCEEIVDMGVALAIDDFGTGFSSLGLLSRFPFRTIKIDKSLIRDIEASSKDAAIIETIIRLSEHLEMEVLAEGVETEAQLDILKRLGCHEVQGYLCGHPSEPEDIDQLLMPDSVRDTDSAG
ncbi:putative bifunctional diguanylate cyclase/phosphodiesterase [Paenibacillus tarimensis]|uniref:putative bifunctional diguanylate cyclase/phosphodiesterase n=1 Tax=Paenibacillus tarimensis TaxID=416012 RepID=UPI001F1AEC2B|nr:bifunctional diguanylate cyclase/phosphodiesterase [Paenibacillus tarimensis]MCF2943716.1 EAL domain-containing protein [Paenibacillus tarimensis]